MPNHSIWDDTTNPPAWRAATAADVGSGTSTVTVDGTQLSLPQTIPLAPNTPVTMQAQGMVDRSISVTVDAGDTVVVRWRLTAGGAWQVFGTYTTSVNLILQSSVQALQFEQTAGTGDSFVEVA